MGCNPSKTLHQVEYADHTSTTTSERQNGKTCPYDHASLTSQSADADIFNCPNVAASTASPNNTMKTFLKYLLQTIFLFAALWGLIFVFYKFATGPFFSKVLDMIFRALEERWQFISAKLEEIDFLWLFRNPAERWYTKDIDWDLKMSLNIGVVAFTLLCFFLDLLFSEEKEQGNWLMMVPAFGLSIAYMIMSIHGQTSKVLDLEMYLSKNITLMGEKLFEQAEFLVFTHLFALDLACSFAFLKDFYSRISSRLRSYRLMMIPLTFLTPLQGITSIPVYLLFRQTLFMGPKILAPRPLSTNRNRFLRSFEYLYDPIPEGGRGLTGWISQIPAPFRSLFGALYVVRGLVLTLLMVLACALYAIFICLPVAAVFFSLRRSFKCLFGMQVQGAIFGPFETLRHDGRLLPDFPKAIIVVSGHLRLMCLKHKKNPVFRLLIGLWVTKFLELTLTMEFLFSFVKGKGMATYTDFLMEEFGDVFPIGQGLGFGKYKDVKAIMENPNLRKGSLSVISATSGAQQNWSKNTLPELPTEEIERAIVQEGRTLVREWLRDVGTNFNKPMTQKRLDAILPFKNIDGTLLDKEEVMVSFGSTLFHLITNGELTSDERQALYKLIFADQLFASDWMHKFILGGKGQERSIQRYDVLRKAFLRYLDASSLQRSLVLAENWDAWTPSEVVRFLTICYAVNGAGAGPSQLLWALVEKLYNDKRLVEIYHRDKRKFILECARLERALPVCSFVAHDFRLRGKKTVKIFDNEIEVVNGTRLHCSIMSANRDKEVFGDDASSLNFNRDYATLGKMMTFNGNLNDIDAGIEKGNLDSPPRRCPASEIALDILVFLIDRYCPEENCIVPPVPKERLDEIRSNQTWLQSFLLTRGEKVFSKNNKYFPHASEVKHPLETRGRQLGSKLVFAAGRRYIPTYDEDVDDSTESLLSELQAVLLSLLPITDDEGEWKDPKEAIAWRMTFFNSNFPPPNIDYTKYDCVAEKIESFAFGGISCFHTQKVSDFGGQSLIYQNREEGAVFVNDNTALGIYKVRRGYQRYGAAAYFDKESRLIGIYTCCDKRYHSRPKGVFHMSLEDEEFSEWRHAMWVWRVSALALATVADHLVNVHMIAANTLVSSIRTCLPINHPVRCFLKMFTYRTVSINNKAHTVLIRRKGVVNRNWAFQEDDLQKLLSQTKCTFKKKFTDHIPLSMRKVNSYPANNDLTKFWEIVRRMVEKMLRVIYDSQNMDGHDDQRMQRSINNDKHLQKFLEELANGLELVQGRDLANFDDIVDVLSSLICTVTGMHEHVGQISDFFADPKTCGTTIRRGREIDSIQIYQLNCTLVSSTGLRMPRLMGNWNHLLDRKRFADDAVTVMEKFQTELRELSVSIEEANKIREKRFQMKSFNPVFLESSVSV